MNSVKHSKDAIPQQLHLPVEMWTVCIARRDAYNTKSKQACSIWVGTDALCLWYGVKGRVCVTWSCQPRETGGKIGVLQMEANTESNTPSLHWEKKATKYCGELILTIARGVNTQIANHVWLREIQ